MHADESVPPISSDSYIPIPMHYIPRSMHENPHQFGDSTNQPHVQSMGLCRPISKSVSQIYKNAPCPSKNHKASSLWIQYPKIEATYSTCVMQAKENIDTIRKSSCMSNPVRPFHNIHHACNQSFYTNKSCIEYVQTTFRL